mgnify:CR=1 FL=1|tara:strand:- start:3355 stop:3786 length:432 start_codon:yes stop_codon:yes gene_type:complete
MENNSSIEEFTNWVGQQPIAVEENPTYHYSEGSCSGVHAPFTLTTKDKDKVNCSHCLANPPKPKVAKKTTDKIPRGQVYRISLNREELELLVNVRNMTKPSTDKEWDTTVRFGMMIEKAIKSADTHDRKAIVRQSKLIYGSEG